MSDRESAWARRAEEATGSRRVTAGSVGGGVLDDIDALLAEEEETGQDSPKDEDEPPL
jgi:hypothetical protein